MATAGGADCGRDRGGGVKRRIGSSVRGDGSNESGEVLMLPMEEDVLDVLKYYERNTARLEKRRKKTGSQRPRAYGLEHMVTMTFEALDDTKGCRAAQVIAEMRRQFPQLSAHLFAEDWEAQACCRSLLPHAAPYCFPLAHTFRAAGKADTGLAQGPLREACGEEGSCAPNWQRRRAEGREEGPVSPQTASCARFTTSRW